MTTTRDSAREQLALLYEPYALAAQAVFDHKPLDANGLFPFVAIESSGVDYTQQAYGRFKASYKVVYSFVIHHFVLAADEKSSWTKRQAEKALDSMSDQLFTFMTENPNSNYWSALYYTAPSTIFDDIKLGGEQYIVERFPIALVAS